MDQEEEGRIMVIPLNVLEESINILTCRSLESITSMVTQPARRFMTVVHMTPKAFGVRLLHVL